MSVSFDIAVIGSGAAGIAAAVSAARTGRSTLLLDKNHWPGGTGGFSGLTTLCGLYDDAGNFLNEGFAREFAEAVSEGRPPARIGRVWVLPYRPEIFRTTAEVFFAATPRLQSRWNQPLQTVSVENGRIAAVNGTPVGAVIDCTGEAEVARAAGAECLATDETTQAPAVVFPLHNVVREWGTAADAAQVLLPLARAGFPPVYFQPDLEPGSFTVKFTGPPERVPPLLDFLRIQVRGFENASTPLKTFHVSRRAGRMIVGEHILTGAEVLAGATFPDAAARCAWPVEQWDPDGRTRLRYLPPGRHYEIPARSLRAAGIKNLFMAGKTISADADAIGSARVMGCCLATGAAAGKLAAIHLTSGRQR